MPDWTEPIDPNDLMMLTWSQIEMLPPGRRKALEYLLSALITNGAHHKQWCIEEAVVALGVDLDALRDLGFDWDAGIAP